MSDWSVDEELVALFRDEVSRREKALRSAHTDSNSALRSLHSLKGSASMMGAKSLAKQIASLEVWVKTVGVTQPDALWNHLLALLDEERISTPPLERQTMDVAKPVVQEEPTAEPGVRTSSSVPPILSPVQGKLHSGAEGSSTSTRSPSIPPKPSIDSEIRQFFGAESRSRMEQFANALTRARQQEGSLDALRESFTHIHAVKGGALTVGFPVVAQGAHAMESVLSRLLERNELLTDVVYEGIARAAGLLTLELGLLEESERISQEISEAVGMATTNAPLRTSPTVQREPASYALSNEPVKTDAIRISSEDLVRLEERIADVLSLSEQWSTNNLSALSVLQKVRSAIEHVEDATRKLGPPRPWGVTQETLDRYANIARELRECAAVIEADAYENARAGEQLATMAASSQESMLRLSVTDFQWICARLAPVIESAARATEKDVRVERTGSELTLPRRIAERLVEPLSQIARNAVTHGIEAPSVRKSRGKPSRGLLRLNASASNTTLTFSIEDDGAGIDFAAVKTRATALGIATTDASDEQITAALFSTGFSLRNRADTLAGRGVGLDLVRREVLALGGKVSVQSTVRERTKFVIEVPVRTSLLSVLIVVDHDVRIAIPIESIVEVRALNNDERPMRLHEWLRTNHTPGASVSEFTEQRRVGVRLIHTDASPLLLEVSAVEQAREVLVRPMPTLLAGWGQWLGAVIDTDNSVLLVAAPPK